MKGGDKARKKSTDKKFLKAAFSPGGRAKAEALQQQAEPSAPAQYAPLREALIDEAVKADAASMAAEEPAQTAPQTVTAPAPIVYASPVAQAVKSLDRAPDTSKIGTAKIGTAKIGAIVLATVDGASPEAAIRSLGEAATSVYVTDNVEGDGAAIARRAGAHIAEISSEDRLTRGRAGNAGYRELKKLAPDVAYVQIMDANSALDPDWLETAAKFLGRRPEVAAIDGGVCDSKAKRSVFARAGNCFSDEEPGEIQATQPVAFFRASGFETVGGFRGDIVANEIADLCIRLRRRGAHIWRADADMVVSGVHGRGQGGWWARRVREGYEIASGAALHGAPPERFRVNDQSRSVFWGLFFPLLVMISALGAAFSASLFAPLTGPLTMFLTVLGLGAGIYAFKVVVTAFRISDGAAPAFVMAVIATLGHIPEAIGVLRYIFRGRKSIQAETTS